jgi:hypothetical protein
MNKRGVVDASNTSLCELGKYYADQGYSPDDLHQEVSELSTSEQMSAIAAYEAQQEWLLMMEELASL